MKDRNRKLVPHNWSLVRGKSADHWTLFGRFIF